MFMMVMMLVVLMGVNLFLHKALLFFVETVMVFLFMLFAGKRLCSSLGVSSCSVSSTRSRPSQSVGGRSGMAESARGGGG